METTAQPMNGTRSTAHARAAIDSYRREQVLNLTPVQTIYKLLDLGVQACKKEDKGLAVRVLTELTLALNFEYRDVALGLFRLYGYCKHCVHHGNFQDAIVILNDLRATWAQAFHLKEAA